MALTFLAHKNEDLDLKTDDLDKILDKGDALYKRTIGPLKTVDKNRSPHLTMEETPNTVETQYNRYRVIKSDVQMGYMRDQGKSHQLKWFLNLRDRLQCLSKDVNYALLTISPNTISCGYMDTSILIRLK